MTDESATAPPEAPVAGHDGHEPRADQSGGQRAAAEPPEPNNPYWTSPWRVYYRPGDWPVLAGPTSVVVLHPTAERRPESLDSCWQQLVAAASIDELAAVLATFRCSEVPDLAVLFWGPGGMRSLVRGRVSILDPRSDVPVANGEGIQTWTEIGLGGLSAVRVAIDTPPAGSQADVPELPLVVGAVRASEILLDASAEMRLVSPQGTYAGVPESLAEEVAESYASGEPRREEPNEPLREESNEPLREEPNASEPEVLVSPPAAVDDAGAQPIPGVDDSPAASGNSVPAPPAQPVAAVLHLSDGTETEVEVDRPVLIGRAPVTAQATGEELPRLVTVPGANKGVSRTHIQVTPAGEQVRVRDMDSTNGTMLIGADGNREQLPSGQDIPAAIGSVIDLGGGMTIAIDRPGP